MKLSEFHFLEEADIYLKFWNYKPLSFISFCTKLGLRNLCLRYRKSPQMTPLQIRLVRKPFLVYKGKAYLRRRGTKVYMRTSISVKHREYGKVFAPISIENASVIAAAVSFCIAKHLST